eukprot:TRINITY_DN47701_c0_g1_i1.p1 TRINITY_DN47701_c0_g1~~TRINITY_DN47701_c0_g1_i1.p1  ORF type:complete len:475 (-),score=115.74 TRINITY_DN47701_c0_g1_i1:33-1457(-)
MGADAAVAAAASGDVEGSAGKSTAAVGDADAAEAELETSEEGDDGANAEARRRRAAIAVLAHQLSTVSLSLLTLQPRQQLLAEAVGGDSVKLASYMNRSTAILAFSDFLASPHLGALSDRIGRRPLMLLAPVVTLPLKSLAAVRPTAFVLMLERIITDGLRTLCGTTLVCSSLADLYEGKAFTEAMVRVNSASGLAIVLAPLVTSRVINRIGGARAAFVAAAVLAGVHLLVGLRCLDETLGLSRKAAQKARAGPPGPAKGNSQSAFGFLRLFTGGERMRLRAFLLSLHCIIEGKILQDQASILQLSQGWSLEARSKWTSGLGLAILVGTRAAGPLLKRLGEQTFTSACHLFSLIAFLAMRGGYFWGGLVALSFGQQRRTASLSWLVEEAGRAGLGRGETLGCTASLRSAVDFSAAFVYSAAHQLATRRGRPLDLFWLPVLVSIMAEVLRGRVAHQDALDAQKKAAAASSSAAAS